MNRHILGKEKPVISISSDPKIESESSKLPEKYECFIDFSRSCLIPNVQTKGNQKVNIKICWVPVMKTDEDFLKNRCLKIEWPYQGNRVFVRSSIDNWQTSILLYRNEETSTREITLLLLDTESLQYKFIVDGVWMFRNDKPVIADRYGNINNYFTFPIQKPIQFLVPPSSSASSSESSSIKAFSSFSPEFSFSAYSPSPPSFTNHPLVPSPIPTVPSTSTSATTTITASAIDYSSSLSPRRSSIPTSGGVGGGGISGTSPSSLSSSHSFFVFNTPVAPCLLSSTSAQHSTPITPIGGTEALGAFASAGVGSTSGFASASAGTGAGAEMVRTTSRPNSSNTSAHTHSKDRDKTIVSVSSTANSPHSPPVGNGNFPI